MTEDQIETAVQMRAQGNSLRQIGAVLNMDHTNVLREFRKDEIKQQIQELQKELIIKTLSTACQNQTDKIEKASSIIKSIGTKDKLPEGSIKLVELAQDCENRLLESVGIHNTRTSTQITNILNVGSQELSPAIESLLTKHLLDSGKVEGNVIEGEIIEPIEGNNKD